LHTIQHALLTFILNIKIHFDLVLDLEYQDLVLEHHDLDFFLNKLQGLVLVLEHQGLDLEC